MTADVLLREIHRLVDAPNAVDGLRRFVFALAMCGGLSTSEAEVGLPSAEDHRPLQSLRSRLEPYELPRGWRWSTTAEIGTARLGKMLDKAKNRGTPRRYLRNTNVRWFDFDLSDLKVMPFEDSELAEFALRAGDVLICEGGEPGRAAVWDDRDTDIYFQKAAHRVRLHGHVLPQFLVYYLRSAAYEGRLAPHATGATFQHLTGQGLARLPIPVPPVDEQRRLVKRIDELMALCDELEAAQNDREARRDLLRATALRNLVSGDESKESGRFFVQHSPRMIRKPEHVIEIRQAVFDLAIEGRLVCQDPRDEPVSGLLAVNDERRIVAAAVDRRAESLSRVLLAAELRWTTPATWEWRGLADLALFIDYRGKTPVKAHRGVRLITAKNVRPGFVNLEPAEFIAEAEYDRWMTRGLPTVGDVLFTTEAPMGYAATVALTERFALAQRVIDLRTYGAVDPAFLVLVLNAPHFQSVLGATATGLTAKGIKAAKLKRLPIPVPPLVEQRRIVLKVKELMAVCAELELSLVSEQTERSQLQDALLRDALQHAVPERELELLATP